MSSETDDLVKRASVMSRIVSQLSEVRIAQALQYELRPALSEMSVESFAGVDSSIAVSDGNWTSADPSR